VCYPTAPVACQKGNPGGEIFKRLTIPWFSLSFWNYSAVALASLAATLFLVGTVFTGVSATLVNTLSLYPCVSRGYHLLGSTSGGAQDDPDFHTCSCAQDVRQEMMQRGQLGAPRYELSEAGIDRRRLLRSYGRNLPNYQGSPNIGGFISHRMGVIWSQECDRCQNFRTRSRGTPAPGSQVNDVMKPSRDCRFATLPNPTIEQIQIKFDRAAAWSSGRTTFRNH